MRRLLYAVVLCCAVAACARQPQLAWATDNPADHDFDKERYACLKEASDFAPSQAANGTDVLGDPYAFDINSQNRENLMTACMKTKGWTLQPVASSSPH
jgi:hypothetical protein